MNKQLKVLAVASMLVAFAPSSAMATKKIGRDASTGQFKPVKEAQKDKKGSVVETIKTPPKKGK